MNAGLEALLRHLIDYAGLFPPARLPLAKAVANYASYSHGPDAWMLGRFICPAARLRELAETLAGRPGFTVSALGRGGATTDEFLANLQADLSDLHSLSSAQAPGLTVDGMEVRVPAEVARSPHEAERVLAGLAQVGLNVFVELPGELASSSELSAFLSLLRHHGTLGYKLRTGGLEASAFPPAQQVAFVVSACAAAGVPFKATAGLHHPFPTVDAALGARMHGFVNLFAAGVLASACGLAERQVQDILEDEDSSHFAFTDQGLRWCSFTASADEIDRARREAFLSFGSCSFDEPREDLRQAGWL